MDKLSVLVVGGGPRCLALLDEVSILCSEDERLELVGYIADNPALDVPGKGKRYTSYPEFACYPEKLKRKASFLKLPTYSGYVTQRGRASREFNAWLDNLGVIPSKVIFMMACYGQKISRQTIDLCNGAFINTHPVESGLPWNDANYCKGTMPWELMLNRNATSAQLVAHMIDEYFDCGLELLRVGPIRLIEHTGRTAYERSLACGKKQTCRPRELGTFVYAMHLISQFATRVLARLIFSSNLIDALIKGKTADRSLIDSIFQKKEIDLPRGDEELEAWMFHVLSDFLSDSPFFSRHVSDRRLRKA